MDQKQVAEQAFTKIALALMDLDIALNLEDLERARKAADDISTVLKEVYSRGT